MLLLQVKFVTQYCKEIKHFRLVFFYFMCLDHFISVTNKICPQILLIKLPLVESHLKVKIGF